MLGPTHNDLSADEVQRRQRAERIDRLRRYLQTQTDAALLEELADATEPLDIRVYDANGQEVA